jgi:hypothetical protein
MKPIFSANAELSAQAQGQVEMTHNLLADAGR